MTQDASVNSDARSLMARCGRRPGSADAGQVSPLGVRPTATMRFGDLFNLVCHPDYLLVAWEHVARNKGARTAGIDGVTVRRIERGRARSGCSCPGSPPA